MLITVRVKQYLVLLLVGAGVTFVADRLLMAGALPHPAARALSSPGMAGANYNFIAAAVAKVGPAVVRIDADRTVSPPGDTPRRGDRRFFGPGGN